MGGRGGILLGVTGKNGNNDFFHVAFDVVDNNMPIGRDFYQRLGMHYMGTMITQRLLHLCLTNQRASTAQLQRLFLPHYMHIA